MCTRSRIAGVLLIGLILVGAAPTGSAQDIPLDFFVDPETGKPAVVIVVGSQAASEDVISAARLAVKISSMGEEPGDVAFVKPSQAVHENVNLLSAHLSTAASLILSDEVERIGFCTVDVPDAGAYNEWEGTPPINYTLSLWYFDDSNGFWGNNDGHFQPWETHEEIQIRFDSSKEDAGSSWTACLFGDFEQAVNSDLIDSSWFRIPGLMYRIDNIFVPPSIIMEAKYSFSTEGLDYERRQSFFIPEPWLIMNHMLPQVTLFDTTYTVVDGGPLWDANNRTGEYGHLFRAPYLLTGEPHFDPQVYLYQHEPQNFGSYTVELMETKIGDAVGWAWFEISLDGEVIESFWMVLDPHYGFPLELQQGRFPFYAYDSCDDLNDNSIPDPGEMTSIELSEWDWPDYAHCNKWVVGRAEKDVWLNCEWEYYVDDKNDTWLLFNHPNFALDGVGLFTDEQGVTGVEVMIYWLENEKAWCSHMCGDPWDCERGYQVFFDAYESGWDAVSENSYVYQPPGTGLWPPSGLEAWTDKKGNSIFVGNGFLDCNDGHIGYEGMQGLPQEFFPEQHDLDRDGSITNDCRITGSLKNCEDLWDIEDPAVWHGPGVIMVEMNVFSYSTMCASVAPWYIPGPYLKEPPHFLVTVTDEWFKGVRSGITYEVTKESIIHDVTTVDIDETGLVITDAQFDFARWGSVCSYNIILGGGPVANAVVCELVDEGLSTVDWATSPGEWEYITVYSCDILVVAGKDRESTSAAVRDLIAYL